MSPICPGGLVYCRLVAPGGWDLVTSPVPWDRGGPTTSRVEQSCCCQPWPDPAVRPNVTGYGATRLTTKRISHNCSQLHVWFPSSWHMTAAYRPLGRGGGGVTCFIWTIHYSENDRSETCICIMFIEILLRNGSFLYNNYLLLNILPCPPKHKTGISFLSKEWVMIEVHMYM